MTDFFGYKRENPGQYLMSSDYAAIYLANSKARTTAADRLSLVQSTAVSYQHRVEPRFEAGSSEMYWLTGQAIGEISIGRLVGEAGFLAGFKNTLGVNASTTSTSNGVIGTLEFKAGYVDGNQDVHTFSGGVMRSAAWSTSAGSLEISEAISVSVACLQSKNMGSAFTNLLAGTAGTAVGDMLTGNQNRITADVLSQAQAGVGGVVNSLVG